ncbi:MAG: hypothetical protein ACLQMT_06840 [Candidatus Acidiferrales bacterium]
MPDYIYLLESRLSPEQRAVLERVQELARSQEMNIYLTGGAVRDMICGQSIRDLDFTVEGNPVRMVRELEKGGARVVWESERLRHHEIIFAGDVEGSISAARDEVYERPGAKPELHFSSIMEDLRRRDFAINAIAISLNAQSRGLLLDPANGLADLERQEVRALSIHAFTNQPVRLLRILRYCARMGFKMEQRTQEWFDLAMERGLQANIEPDDAGNEVRSLAREDNPAATLKQWDTRGLLAAVHPQLQKRKPDYDGLGRLSRARGNLLAAGIRARLGASVTYYVLRRLKPRGTAAAMRQMGFRAAEVEAVGNIVAEGREIVQALRGRKTNAPRDAYFYLASLPPEMLAFIPAELPNGRAVSKIRSYIQKWRPMRLALPAAELSALGIAHGPKFDKILEQLFEMQLRGKARSPEDRTKALRQLAGIKEEPKKKPEKEKKKHKGKEPAAHAAKGPDTKAAAAAPHGKVHAAAAQPGRGKEGAAPFLRQGKAASVIGARAQAKHEKEVARHSGARRAHARKAKAERGKRTRRR